MRFPNASQIEAELTPSDGRLYDLSEENDVLSVRLRRGVAWERKLIMALIVLLWGGINFTMSAMSFFSSPRKFDSVLQGIQQLAMFPYIYFSWCNMWVTRQSWKLDKQSGKVCCGKVPIASLNSIYGVKAWQRGAKFHIALKSKNDKPRQLGHFGFGRSERAWRDDAAQIAAFLGVPLEIAPAVD
ncbi:MAG TPA: hypothetical protein VF627_14990 [Abditibacterium sp.]